MVDPEKHPWPASYSHHPPPSTMPVTDTFVRHDIVATYRQVKTIKGTARQLGLTVKVVKHWVSRWKETRTVEPKGKPGRPRALDPLGAAQALDWLKQDGTGRDAVARKLHEEGYTAHKIHRTTVGRVTKKLARTQGQRLRAQTGRPQVILTQANKDKRLSFAKANRSRDWTKVMFTDRKKFLLHNPGTSITPVTWTVGDQMRIATRVTNPVAVNVYAGVTVHGVTKCHLVTGTRRKQKGYLNKKGEPARNITAAEYTDVVKHTFLPEGDRLFGRRGVTPNWVLQQDNDPTHRAAHAVVVGRNRTKMGRVELLQNWPPNSPDLSIIENLWAYVDGKVKAMACKTGDEFEQAVLQQMKAVPKHYITSLFDSIQGRMEAVIKNKGDRLKC